MAGENQALWNVYLKWSSLNENLKGNMLVDDIDAGRLTAHYRFLRGYAHPVVDHRPETYRQHALLGWPSTTTTAANSSCCTRSPSAHWS
jgi:hypothetical protein